jgi:hypothetical protein
MTADDIDVDAMVSNALRLLVGARLADGSCGICAVGPTESHRDEFVCGLMQNLVVTVDDLEERLHLAAMLATKLEISDYRYDPDARAFVLALKGHVLPLIAASLGAWFVDMEGQNYVEAQVEFPPKASLGLPHPLPLGRLVVTVQRQLGQTPHALKAEADARADGLAEALRAVLLRLAGQPRHPSLDHALMALHEADRARAARPKTRELPDQRGEL